MHNKNDKNIIKGLKYRKQVTLFTDNLSKEEVADLFFGSGLNFKKIKSCKNHLKQQ